MRIAVLSDIHSNITALNACLREAERYAPDEYIFLGDFVSDCSSPAEVMDTLYALSAPCTFIRGNREEYLIRAAREGSDWRYDSQTGSLLYTLNALREKDIAFFEGLSNTGVWEREGCAPLLLCHGSPDGVRDRIDAGTEKERLLAARFPGKTLLCGHTHIAFAETAGTTRFVNSGAVGVPSDGCPYARFAILESDGGCRRDEIVTVEYDIEGEIGRMRACGLFELAPCWARAIAAQLRTGREWALDCIRLAGRLSIAAGAGRNDRIAERFWREAADRLGL